MFLIIDQTMDNARNEWCIPSNRHNSKWHRTGVNHHLFRFANVRLSFVIYVLVVVLIHFRKRRKLFHYDHFYRLK
jgi:hypothetical protein